jgi:hypothetical protein
LAGVSEATAEVGMEGAEDRTEPTLLPR